MLISHKHLFVFIHVPRTGGTSIEKLLSPYADIVSENRNDTITFSHVSASLLKRHFTEMNWRWDDYTKIAFVRNPWSRLVSYYNFFHSWGWFIRCWGELSFEAWIERGFVESDEIQRMFPGHVSSTLPEPMNELLMDSDGKLLVDRLGRFEHLAQDLRKIVADLRISLPADLPKINTSTVVDYRSYFSKSLESLVHSRFQKDVEFFGYEF